MSAAHPPGKLAPTVLLAVDAFVGLQRESSWSNESKHIVTDGGGGGGWWMVDGRKKGSPILLKIFSDEVQVI